MKPGPTAFEQMPEALRTDMARMFFTHGDSVDAVVVTEALALRTEVMERLGRLDKGEALLVSTHRVAAAVREVLASSEKPEVVADFLTALVFADLIQSRSLVSTTVKSVMTGDRNGRGRKPKQLEEQELSESASEALALVCSKVGVSETDDYEKLTNAIKAVGISEVAMAFAVALYPADTKPSLDLLGTFVSGKTFQAMKAGLQWKYRGETNSNKKMAPETIQAHCSRVTGGYLQGRYAEKAQANLDTAWALLR